MATNPAHHSTSETRTASVPAATALAWLALVAFAVAGRLWQPTWNGEPLWHATPLAAVALAAGFVFPNPLVAASVPVAALAVSNLVLPGYGNLGVAAAVYLATAWPVVLGCVGLLGRDRPRWAAIVGGSLASSLVFFVTTNLAHWAFTTDYPRTFAGLGDCYAAALPFYRWMPVGDLAWSGVVFGMLAAARTFGGVSALEGSTTPEPAIVRRSGSQAISARPLD